MVKKQTKYGNRKPVYDGQKFDSSLEMLRYIHLLELQKRGKIHDLKRQVPFVLVPTAYERNGEVVFTEGSKKRADVLVERGVKYRADFVYMTKDNVRVVEDTKGFKTADYIVKRKLMLYMHGIRITEITAAAQ